QAPLTPDTHRIRRPPDTSDGPPYGSGRGVTSSSQQLSPARYATLGRPSYGSGAQVNPQGLTRHERQSANALGAPARKPNRRACQEFSLRPTERGSVLRVFGAEQAHDRGRSRAIASDRVVPSPRPVQFEKKLLGFRTVASEPEHLQGGLQETGSRMDPVRVNHAPLLVEVDDGNPVVSAPHLADGTVRQTGSVNACQLIIDVAAGRRD